MATTHNLGFPRIGAQRELKFGLESYWRGETDEEHLHTLGETLRRRHWDLQSVLDWVPVGDFSQYDQVLDMSFTLGNIPQRIVELPGDTIDAYFRNARGRSRRDQGAATVVAAGDMTKWFDSNYHYIVPEFASATTFSCHPERLLAQWQEASREGLQAKPVILGPLTYLWLGKTTDGSDRLELLDRLLPVYDELLNTLAAAGVQWVQMDEPILATELDGRWQKAVTRAYHRLKPQKIKLLVATYFGELRDNLQLACELPVDGLHVDAVAGAAEITQLVDWLPVHKVLSLGVVNGRNIWRTDLCRTLDRLEPIARKLGDRLWLAPSCSLLHVPVDLQYESDMDPELRGWLAFAVQKLDELRILGKALNEGRESVQEELAANQQALIARRASVRTSNPEVRRAAAQADAAMACRNSTFPRRARKQQKRLRLPPLPTTTIGSFPQTDAIREARKGLRTGELNAAAYDSFLRHEISDCIRRQEELGIDVLVHGEAERNDMVEYFSEHLQGFARSAHGWVQSYGSRCVKPPILFGDVHRPLPITVQWAGYAQSLSSKPVKGMLTGPVTLLNWSFVRDDQPRAATCLQIALAMRGEVLDLEKAGIAIIQIDEAALREGLPLRASDWTKYLEWAVYCFRVTANGVADETQIHTHMCYSEFNDIMPAIAAMDADVITIETSRSQMELLDAFEDFEYPNAIGPGVYDIHSPNIPTTESIVALMNRAKAYVPAERLWVNPDCGLKTRRWEEVLPALRSMVAAARALRLSAAAPAVPECAVRR